MRYCQFIRRVFLLRTQLKLVMCIQWVLMAFCFSGLAARHVNAQTPVESGRILMSIGDVKIVRNGQSSPAPKGASIQPGDTIVTGVASNAQLRMSDAAVIALRAQTEFKINEYKFNGKADGSEKANLSLVKGGVRAVTGSIGRENKDNLQVNAVVATVGIRGTGYNLNYCEGNCLTTDNTAVKNGLYAGVFEGQITIKNGAGAESLGVDQYAYVADENAQPIRLLQPPNFLPDPLAGQKSIKTKGIGGSNQIPSLAVAVTVPAKGADIQVTPPSSALPTSLGVVLNSTLKLPIGPGDGVAPTPGVYSLYLQKAEVWPTGPIQIIDNLPPHNVSTDSNPSTIPPITGLNSIKTAGSGLSTHITQINLPSNYVVRGSNVPVLFSIGSAQQIEGGNLSGIISWGRWANGNVILADYNSGNLISMPANNGFHFVVGDRTNPNLLQNLGPVTLNFSLVGATTPTYVSSVPGATWSVTGGNLTANFAGNQISGNLGLATNQSAGSANLNMAIFGGLSASAPSNEITTSVIKTGGSNPICSSACSGAGQVVFYGGNSSGTSPAQAAGLSYNFSTSGNVVQGVAVFKR